MLLRERQKAGKGRGKRRLEEGKRQARGRQEMRHKTKQEEEAACCHSYS